MKVSFTFLEIIIIVFSLVSHVLYNNILAQPELEWSKVFAWEGNSRDQPVEIELSDSGNVYIGGQCSSGRLIMKYDQEGNLLWNKTSLGQLQAIAVDRWGNVVVTGSGAWESNYTCFYTTKYASNNGAPIWANKVTPIFLSFLDSGWDVDVDSNGKAYATGWYWNGSAPFGTGSDWMTLSYQPSGVESSRRVF